MVNSLVQFKDYLHAKLCYQIFITPLHFMVEKKYKDFAQRACEYFNEQRTESFHYHEPKHYILHRFAPKNNDTGRKILLAHGWMSRAAYMSKLIDSLVNQGFEVYAIDFPAHGEAKGRQLVWTDAVLILKKILCELGPFYAAIGHSFGGSMLLNALNLSRQFAHWHIQEEPEKIVLLAAPTRMRTPVKRLAKQLKLSPKAYLQLHQVFKEQTLIDINRLNFQNFTEKARIPFLCIHGKDDQAIDPKESIIFCENYSYASLVLLAGINHINILIDERVDQTVSAFLHLDDGIYVS
ncbi:putative hydrolase (plasmid) [Legionella adelaidensis]|uniref:Putative hydrolase n=1 Tax=Legionella adelaidensis TaxID=45056 RepID=A0A0W0R657_9GAMM|nr:alpha/beta fold hydrolase [Legionella adelaidensis]KTC66575.1 putative hydrolase [Legionella adelaidensis]VEH85485.1 putative hydrolase [Legionella adelaidensis]